MKNDNSSDVTGQKRAALDRFNALLGDDLGIVQRRFESLRMKINAQRSQSGAGAQVKRRVHRRGGLPGKR